MKRNARPTKRTLPETAQRRLSRSDRAGSPPPDPWWLDEPIRRPWGRGYGHDFNPKLLWFVDRLPGRTRGLLLRAAHGELRAQGPGSHGHLPPVQTLRGLILMPTYQVLLQHHYGYKSHTALCRAFRENGVTGQLFSGDEDRLKPDYIP